MAYIGRDISNLSDRVVLDNITASATATYNLLLNSVAFVPSSAESLTVSLNGVIQKPQSSYTVSGATIVFASALTSSDSIDFIIAERAITLTTVGSGSVGTSQIVDGSVSNAKLANSSITLNGSAVALGGSATIGGGKIGQVIQTSLDGIVELTSSSGTFVDITGFNASITPSATDSKILVNCSINYGGTGNLYGATRLLRGSTAIGVGASAGSRTPATVFTSSGDFTKAVNSAVQFLDTPSTTSSTTYKLQVTLNSGQTFKLNSEGENIDNAANHRTISTMTLMEVLA